MKDSFYRQIVDNQVLNHQQITDEQIKTEVLNDSSQKYPSTPTHGQHNHNLQQENSNIRDELKAITLPIVQQQAHDYYPSTLKNSLVQEPSFYQRNISVFSPFPTYTTECAPPYQLFDERKPSSIVSGSTHQFGIEPMKFSNYNNPPTLNSNIGYPGYAELPTLPHWDDYCSSKRKRVSFTRKQVFELEKEFLSSRYIARERRLQISATLLLTENQIKTWFQNRRMKLKRLEKMEKKNSNSDNANLLSKSDNKIDNLNLFSGD